jgi:hypothetical protein
VLGKHARRNLRGLLDELVHGIRRDFWTCVGKVHERFEARVGLPQHGVAVAGNDTAGLEDAPQEVVDVLSGELCAN